MSDGKDTTQLSFGFLLGSLMGAAAVLFFRTREGKKVGRLIAEKGKYFIHQLLDVFSELENQAQYHIDTVQKAEEQANNLIQSVRRDQSDEQWSDIRSTPKHIEELQKRGRITTEKLRKTLFRNVPKR